MLDVLIFLAICVLCLMLVPWILMLAMGIVAILLSIYETVAEELKSLGKKK